MSRINSLLEFFYYFFSIYLSISDVANVMLESFFPDLYWYDFPKSEQQTQWICDAYTSN